MRKISIILIALLSVLLAFVACNNSIDDAFQPTDPRYMPLTLEFLADGTLSITTYEGYGDSDVYYSRNGEERIKLVNPINVYTGDKICLYRDWGLRAILRPHISIGCSSDCYVYGNVMSLIDSENFATATEVYDSAFYELFAGNMHITNHESLDLVLPASTLANGCYANMFYGCTGLTRAPELPATELAEYCYGSMFQGCTGLTAAPDLLAKEGAYACYMYMFKNCNNIRSFNCQIADASTTYTEKWVEGIPNISEVAFERNPSCINWYRNENGVPTNWTVNPELPGPT